MPRAKSSTSTATKTMAKKTHLSMVTNSNPSRNHHGFLHVSTWITEGSWDNELEEVQGLWG